MKSANHYSSNRVRTAGGQSKSLHSLSIFRSSQTDQVQTYNDSIEDLQPFPKTNEFSVKIKCGKSGCTGSCPLSVVEYGYKAGRKPATCRACGKTFPRPNVTLADFFPVKSDKKKGNISRNVSPVTSRRSRNTSPAISRRSSVVSLSDSPRDQTVPKSEVRHGDCTESHQAEINKKIRANDKLRKILTNMPDEHKSLIYGDSLKAKMQSLDDEKVALLAAKRQFLPLQSRIEKQKNYLERISREIETKQQHRLEILQKWIEADQELDAAHAKEVQAKREMSILVAEQTAENAKAVKQGTSGIQSLSSPSNPDSDAQQTILSVFKSVLSMQNMGCHSVAEQLMAAGATDEEVKKISQIMAQTVRKLEGGNTVPEPRLEMPKPACDVVVLDHQEEFVERSHRKETFGEEMQARGCPFA